MITEIDASLLEKIADLTGKPVGAFNIRKDMGCEARQSTEHIAIDPRADGKPGIDIHFKEGTKGETCHIPVIISQTGMSDMVYNDFYVADDCDVTIVAGCGIHNSGCDESRHDGIHTFHIGKNCRVRYTEKHYGEDAKGETGKNIMNPQTIVYLGENSTMQMDTIQIRGIDSTLRDTQFYCEAGSEVVVTERLLTHGAQTAESDMTIQLNGEGAKGRVISRSVAQDTSRQVFHPVMVGNSQCFGHVQCDSIIMGQAKISSVPEIAANDTEAQLIHEAAIGKIAGEQILKLRTFGLTEEEGAESFLAALETGLTSEEQKKDKSTMPGMGENPFDKVFLVAPAGTEAALAERLTEKARYHFDAVFCPTLAEAVEQAKANSRRGLLVCGSEAIALEALKLFS